ncbi:MAG: alpha/beta hydrolase [Lentisphaerae bacterium]|nr:alpha/beta hydrolase [Lentisphaerota bacterium]
MGVLLSVIRIVVAVYVGLCLLLYFRQSSYVYYPDRQVGLTPAYLRLAFEDVRIGTADGETLAGWYVEAAAGTDEGGADGLTVLLCHGNGGDIGDRLTTLQTFTALGMNVLIFDYRGYGESTGRPSEEGTYADGLAAWHYLTQERGVAADRIVIFGRSLGAAVGTWLAQRVEPAALVLESAFTSAPDMAARMFPYLPVRLLCRFRYDTLSRIGSVGCPVLLMHSRDDEMVAFRHRDRLFAAAAEPRRMIETRGGHNAGGFESDASFIEGFTSFLKEHAAGRGPVPQ